MEKFEKVHTGRGKIFLNNFLGGIAWGLGATIGVTIIVGIISYIVRQINLVPLLGDVATQITSIVLQNLQSTPYLLK